MPDSPEAATVVFGDRLALATRYAGLLAGDGVAHGLIGPREVERLWDRHLINCAVIGQLIPADSYVADLGSGAGLPGIPLAIARPDLHVELLEPMERRAAFLTRAVVELGLGNAAVVRVRGEDAPTDRYDVVTARAVAPMDRLAVLALPLARIGGTLLAMKGAKATAELSAAGRAITEAGGAAAGIVHVTSHAVSPGDRHADTDAQMSTSEPLATVIQLTRTRPASRSSAPHARRRG